MIIMSMLPEKNTSTRTLIMPQLTPMMDFSSAKSNSNFSGALDIVQ